MLRLSCRTWWPRFGRTAALASVLVLCCAAAGRAQTDRRPARDDASPYLSLDHWAYPALDLWIARGDITDLSPMTRPYRIADVASAVRALGRDRLSGAEPEIRDRLLEELGARDGGDETRRGRRRRRARRERTGPRGENSRDRRRDEAAAGALDLELGFEAGGRYVSQTHPDPLQPALDGRFAEDRFLERIEFAARGSSPFAAGAVRLRRDGIYRDDPRFSGGQVTPPRYDLFTDDLSVRVEEAYVELQVPYFRLSLGRLDRNWGPASTSGFLRSANPYSQDEIGYRIGTERVFLIGSISAPADFGGDTVRHLAMHRIEVRPSDRLVIAVSEAALHGGPDGRFRFALANPLGIWQIAVDDQDVAHNKLGQLDIWWRAGRGLVLTGSLLADATNLEGSCCQLGGTLGAELAGFAPGLRVGASVTAIQSLAYRTSLPWEEYSVDGVGLGWDKSDLVLVTLEADWLATGSLRLSPRIDVQRLGEGDFRQPRPPASELPDQPRILSGIVETTLRPSLGGSWRRPGALAVQAEWDLGVSLISDYAHVEGADRTAFTGSVGIRLFAPRWGVRMR